VTKVDCVPAKKKFAKGKGKERTGCTTFGPQREGGGGGTFCMVVEKSQTQIWWGLGKEFRKPYRKGRRNDHGEPGADTVGKGHEE